MALRLRTAWFRQRPKPSAAEQASVLAATLWKLADRLVENLAKGGCTIGTLERGCALLAEVLAFGAHCCDRLAHAHLDECERAALVQHTGERLAGMLEANLCLSRDRFVALLNERSGEYAEFAFPDGVPDYGALRLLALRIRERMDERDRPWVMDQLMEVEMPGVLQAVRDTFRALIRAETT